jgi:putative transcriptional regulator
MKTKHDWSRADARTEEQIRTAALADPDAQPLTQGRLKGMGQTPRLKIIRRALGLTQEEFAARFQIPLGTLRDWEQGAKEPDQSARRLPPVGAAAPLRRRVAWAPAHTTRRSIDAFLVHQDEFLSSDHPFRVVAQGQKDTTDYGASVLRLSVAEWLPPFLRECCGEPTISALAT